MLSTKNEIMDDLYIANYDLKAENLFLVKLVEKGFKEAARYNCFARQWGDINECVNSSWANSKIKRELDELCVKI